MHYNAEKCSKHKIGVILPFLKAFYCHSKTRTRRNMKNMGIVVFQLLKELKMDEATIILL